MKNLKNKKFNFGLEPSLKIGSPISGLISERKMGVTFSWKKTIPKGRCPKEVW